MTEELVAVLREVLEATRESTRTSRELRAAVEELRGAVQGFTAGAAELGSVVATEGSSLRRRFDRDLAPVARHLEEASAKLDVVLAAVGGDPLERARPGYGGNGAAG